MATKKKKEVKKKEVLEVTPESVAEELDKQLKEVETKVEEPVVQPDLANTTPPDIN
jgi:hypothetical protein